MLPSITPAQLAFWKGFNKQKGQTKVLARKGQLDVYLKACLESSCSWWSDSTPLFFRLNLRHVKQQAAECGGLSSVKQECGAVSLGRSIPFHTWVKRKEGQEEREGLGELSQMF